MGTRPAIEERRTPTVTFLSVFWVFYAAPWLWLIAFSIVFAAAVIQFQHPPSYGNPDPKNIEGVSVAYHAAVALIAPTLLSPLFVAGSVLRRTAQKARLRQQAPALAVYAIGFAAFAAIAGGNAFGLMDWLMD